jgi:VWFA-related protein
LAASAVVFALCLLPSALPQAQAQFKSATELVSVDVIATDESGLPISDLTAKDFVLKVDGKVRPVQSVQLVQVSNLNRAPRTGSDPAAGAAATPAPKPLPSPFSTNTEARGRAFIFAIDHESIHPGNERPAIDAAINLLGRLAPEDRAAVVSMPRGRIDADLSTDREAVRKALLGIVGHAPRKSQQFEFSIAEAMAVLNTPPNKLPGDDSFSRSLIIDMLNRECNNQSAGVCGPALYDAARTDSRELQNNVRDRRGLQAFLTGLSALDGTKSVIFISESLVQTNELTRDMVELGKAADLARVRMYVIQVNKPMMDVANRHQPADLAGDLAKELSGLEDVAGVTGGEMFRPSGKMDGVMTTIDRATSAYYLLGFEPTDKERDGKYHKIQLTLTRKDVRLKSRNGFQINAKDATTKTDVDGSPLAAMLRDNIRGYRDLPLRASAFAYRDNETTNVKIVVMAESMGTAKLETAAFAVISESGGQGAEWVADAQDLKASPVISAGSVLPGRYRVRVAATDAIGRQGVVDVTVDAQLAEAAPLQLSSLMAGRLAGATFEPRFDFSDAKDVTGLVEIYSVPLMAGVPTATLDLAATIDGPALVSAEMGVAKTAVADRRIARGTLTIPANAPAGDLVLRARVFLDGRPVGTVVRTVRR